MTTDNTLSHYRRVVEEYYGAWEKFQHNGWYEYKSNYEDAENELLALAPDAILKLLAVAEAAKVVADSTYTNEFGTLETSDEPLEILILALKALE